MKMLRKSGSTESLVVETLLLFYCNCKLRLLKSINQINQSIRQQHGLDQGAYISGLLQVICIVLPT